MKIVKMIVLYRVQCDELTDVLDVRLKERDSDVASKM